MSGDAKAVTKKAKLYYTPTSCGVASFIAAHKAGLHIDTELVDISTHKTASGADFYAINPKGNVPALVLGDGTVLNENTATLAYIADQNLSSGLAPAYGTQGRYKLVNILGFLNSELHPGIGGFFAAKTDEQKAAQKVRAERALKYLENTALAGGNKFLVGDELTIADIYAHIVLGWTAYVGFDLKPWPLTSAFLERIKAHPDVVAAQKVVATKPASL